MRKIQIAISSGLCIRLTWNLTLQAAAASNRDLWMVSYGGKTIPRWRTAAILKIDMSPYLSENHVIFMKFCTQQQILNWMNVTWSTMTKLHWTSTPSSTERISCLFSSHLCNVIIFHLSIFVACLLIKMLVRTTWSARVFRRNCHRYLSARNSSVSK